MQPWRDFIHREMDAPEKMIKNASDIRDKLALVMKAATEGDL